jgi:hypothetical protein
LKKYNNAMAAVTTREMANIRHRRRKMPIATDTKSIGDGAGASLNSTSGEADE